MSRGYELSRATLSSAATISAITLRDGQTAGIGIVVLIDVGMLEVEHGVVDVVAERIGAFCE